MANELPNYVALQERTITANVAGEPVESWRTIAEFWAGVGGMTGREVLYAAQIQAEASSVVLIRWRPVVDRTMRILFDGRTLYINAVVNADGLHYKGLKLFCTEQPVSPRSAP